MSAKVLQIIPVSTQAATVAPGARQRILSQSLPGELDSFLTDFGNSIDVVANSSFATFRVYANGSPIPGFDNITSQIASANQPRHYKPPIKLGRIFLLEVYGEMAAGATGNTVMSCQVTLAAVNPGGMPDV